MEVKNILPQLVVFEGGDGAGTTTQIKLLEENLRSAFAQKSIFTTFEPTGSAAGKLLRSVLSGDVDFCAKTQAYLFAADRCEHIFGCSGIFERCAKGEIVLCDRYILSSLVYQGIGSGEELPKMLNSPFPAPGLLFFFDVDSETSLMRIKKRGSKREIYEYKEFQEAVRCRYKKVLPFCAAQGTEIKIIDASLPVEETAKIIAEAACIYIKNLENKNTVGEVL